MLRILFCLNCCAVPAKGARPSRRRSSQSEERRASGDDESSEFKTSLVALASNKKEPSQGESFNFGSTQEMSSSTLVTNLADQPSSVTMASVSSHNNDFRSFTQKLTDKSNQFLETSMSPSSSIEIEQFKEAPAQDRPKLVGLRSQKPPIGQGDNWYSGRPIDTRADDKEPSTTKIADYARIEYSPVEDLDSLTTNLQSRPSSEKGDGGLVGGGSSKSVPLAPGRQGVESSSISIASQLSSEFEHKLTNMLESASSPTQMFGTIGLPLGPPPVDTVATTETAKTSPENGAALTSASQDSLSGNSIPSRPSSRATAQAANAGFGFTGGALIGASTELDKSVAGESENSATINKEDLSVRSSSVRLESSLSMATTATSTSMNDPTPTPSEMSGSIGSKKRKITAKGLLKKFKPVRKKKNKENNGSDSNK